jgi:hypothetical protein
MMLAVALVAVASVAGGSTASAAPSAPGLGVNVVVFDSSMPAARSRLPTRSTRSRSTRDGDESLRSCSPGVYGSATQPLQLKVGYHTEVAGPRVADRR